MSSPRIAPLSMGQLSVDAERLISETLIGWDQPQNIFLTLVRRPDLMKGATRLGHRLLFAGTVRPRLREIAILRVSWRTGCEYEFGQHSVIGERAGLTPDELVAICCPDPSTPGDEWSDEDKAVIEAVDDLYFRDKISDGTWERLNDVLEEPQLLEFLLLVGFYRMLAGFLQSLEIERDVGLPGWPRGWTSSP